MPGTSPAMTGERVGAVSDPSFASSPALPHPLHCHARACPGHPRRPVPPRGLGPGRDRSGLGAARRGVGGRDKPGHDWRRVGAVSDPSFASSPALPHPLHCHARACPGHPRRPVPPRVLGPGRGRPGAGAARRDVGGRDKPGHDGEQGGDRFGSLIRLLTGPSAPPPLSCPGLSRAPTPARAAAGPRAGPGPSGDRRGSAWRGWPGQARP